MYAEPYDNNPYRFDYESGQEWVQELLDHLYITGDMEKLEDALAEVAAVFDICLPKDPLRIQPIDRPAPHIVDLSTREKLQNYANELLNPLQGETNGK